MYDPSERVIEVSRDFYVELASLLQPEERWVTEPSRDRGPGLVLHVLDYADGDSRKLVFVRKEGK